MSGRPVTSIADVGLILDARIDVAGRWLAVYSV
jgi:hypothetical protein